MALDFQDEYNKVEGPDFGGFFDNVTPEQYERFSKMIGGGMQKVGGGMAAPFAGAGKLLGTAWGKMKSPFQQEEEEEIVEEPTESEGILEKMRSMFGIEDEVTTSEVVPGFNKKEQGVYAEPSRFGPPNAMTQTTPYNQLPEYLQNPEYSSTGNNLMTMLLNKQKNQGSGILTQPFNPQKWSE